jgi:hypothetical protein
VVVVGVEELAGVGELVGVGAYRVVEEDVVGDVVEGVPEDVVGGVVAGVPEGEPVDGSGDVLADGPGDVSGVVAG